VATSKTVALPKPAATTTPDQDVVKSMKAHESSTKHAQSAARSAARATTLAAAKPAAVTTPIEADARIAALTSWRAIADAPAIVLEVVDAAIRRGTATPRQTMPKADPATVAAFFKSTGLSVRAIAEAVGVSTSVISTVTRENGDRWSLARFDAARPLIITAAAKAKAKG
jgi:hypothetical protein